MNTVTIPHVQVYEPDDHLPDRHQRLVGYQFIHPSVTDGPTSEDGTMPDRSWALGTGYIIDRLHVGGRQQGTDTDVEYLVLDVRSPNPNEFIDSDDTSHLAMPIGGTLELIGGGDGAGGAGNYTMDFSAQRPDGLGSLWGQQRLPTDSESFPDALRGTGVLIPYYRWLGRRNTDGNGVPQPITSPKINYDNVTSMVWTYSK